MAKGFSLSIAADTRAFSTAIKKGVQEPLEDAAEILEDIGREGGRDIGEIEDAARDAQRDTEKVRDEFSKLQQEIRDTGRKAKTDFADPMRASSVDVKQELAEVQNEAKQNAAEMFSSFDGSFESIADAAQGTLGGLTAGLGGVGGIAAAAAGAAGIGLISAALQANQEETERLAEVTDQAFSQMLDAKRNYLLEDAIIDNIRAIYEDTEELAKAQRDAAKAGLEESLVVRALAGDNDALSEAQQRVAASIEDVQARAGEYYDQTGELNFALISQEEDLISVREELAKQGGAYDAARDRFNSYQETIAATEQAHRDEVRKSREVEQERWDRLGERYAEFDGKKVTIPTELQSPSVDEMLRTAQRALNARRLEVPLVGRYGREIV